MATSLHVCLSLPQRALSTGLIQLTVLVLGDGENPVGSTMGGTVVPVPWWSVNEKLDKGKTEPCAKVPIPRVVEAAQ